MGGKRVRKEARACEWCGTPFRESASAKKCSTCVGVDVKDRMRWNQSIALYGVDKFMYEAMYFEQDGACLICRDREAACVDHCHATGRVRGLLCLGCNTLVGFMENRENYSRAVEYLREFDYLGQNIEQEWWQR